MRSLFPQINPLRLNLPEDFFRNLPRSPGVYIMKSLSRDVLYVGKAKDLKARLNSYCAADLPRKVQRLIKQVSAIEFEILPSEKEALLRENALLKLLRPPFNRQKTNPEGYFYLQVQRSGGFLKFMIVKEVMKRPDAEIFGAFKGVSSMAKVVMSLQRVLTLHNRALAGDPNQSLTSSLQRERARFPMTVLLVGGSASEDALRLSSRFLRGISKEIIRLCDEYTSACSDPMTKWFLKQDHDILQDFFEGPARRFYRMRRLLEGRSTVDRMELDNLIVEDAFCDTGGTGVAR